MATTKKSNKGMSKKKNKISLKEALEEKRYSKKRVIIIIFTILILTILLTMSSYAWFSTALNVQIRTFNLVVVRNDGLTVSHDAVTYGSYLDISKQMLYDDLGKNYPNYKTMWPTNGLTPVSTIGNQSRNSYFFDVFTTKGIHYPNRIDRTNPAIVTSLYEQDKPKKYSWFLAFDVFFRNESGSPVDDNLYFDVGTGIQIREDIDEEMQGLINSIRIGVVKVGSLPITATPTEVQNIKCNNNCEAIIYEPFSTNHTELSTERAKKFDIELIDGEYYPTYANVNQVGPIWLRDALPNSQTFDAENFKLQQTITEDDFEEPLFTVPYGYTKARIYVWIEGQDVDSIETSSEGTDIDVIVNFIKDTQGYDEFNE